MYMLHVVYISGADSIISIWISTYAHYFRWTSMPFPLFLQLHFYLMILMAFAMLLLQSCMELKKYNIWTITKIRVLCNFQISYYDWPQNVKYAYEAVFVSSIILGFKRVSMQNPGMWVTLDKCCLKQILIQFIS